MQVGILNFQLQNFNHSCRLAQVCLNKALRWPDRRIGVSGSNPLLIDYYASVIMSSSDYYAFGMTMPNRGSAGSYRYGFNGKEKDDELKGSGNSYDFGARMYDPRLGRFLSIDPLSKQFPSESNYGYAGNSPIVLVDNQGEKKTWYILVIDEKGNETLMKVVDHNTVKTKAYKNTITYTEHEGVGFEFSYETTKSFDLKQTVVIDKRKKAGEQVTYQDEQEDGETKSWVGELFEDSPNLIIYGNGKFKGQIEMGSKERGKGKTQVITSDEATAILGAIKAAAGFKQGNMKPIDAERKIVANIDKAVNKSNKNSDPKGDPNAQKTDSSYCKVCGERKPTSETQHTFEEEKK